MSNNKLGKIGCKTGGDHEPIWGLAIAESSCEGYEGETGADPAADRERSERAGGVAAWGGVIGGGGLSYSVFFVSLQPAGWHYPGVE